MRNSTKIVMLIAIIALTLAAQSIYGYDIVGGFAFKESLIITGFNPMGYWEFEVLTLPAEGEQIKLDMETPRGWIEVADDQVGPDGDFLISHPTLEEGVFRVRIGTHPPSYIFHWNYHSMPTEWMEYYYWDW